MMKSIALISGLSAVALAAIVVPASAADVNVDEGVFEGFYFGAHGGYGWSDAEIDYVGNYGTSISVSPQDGDPFEGATDLSGTGPLIGGQIGANFLLGRGLLLGAEVSGSWGAISGDSNFDDGDVGIDIEQNISALGLAQAKLGWAHDRFAIYGLGGIAMGRVDTTADLDLDNGSFNISSLDESQTMTGWTLGAGADYMVTENVSVGLTYNYIDLGDQDSSFTVNETYQTIYNIYGEADVSASVNLHVVKATLNYNF